MRFQNKLHYYKSKTSNIRFRAIINRHSKHLSVIKDKVYEPVGYTYKVGLFGRRIYTNFIIPIENGKEVVILESDIGTFFQVEKYSSI